MSAHFTIDREEHVLKYECVIPCNWVIVYVCIMHIMYMYHAYHVHVHHVHVHSYTVVLSSNIHLHLKHGGQMRNACGQVGQCSDT